MEIENQSTPPAENNTPVADNTPPAETPPATEHPEWFKSSKYKTVEDQAKAYNELESKLGGFTGKPEKYTLAEGIEADADNPLFKGLTEIGAKYNMNNDMYNEIIGMYNTQQTQAQEAFREQQMAELGEDGNTRIKNINDWVKANVPEGFRDNFLNWSQTAKDVEALEALIGMTKGQKIASPDQVVTKAAYTDEGLKELQFATNERGQRLLSVDPEHARKYKEYAKNLESLQNS